MKENDRSPAAFTSCMEKRETILTLIWFPIHLWLLPELLIRRIGPGGLTEAEASFALYAAGAVYMLAIGFRFLRREFDPLCERPFACMLQIGLSYIAMMGFNLCLSGILSALELALSDGSAAANPNNEAVISLALEDYNTMAAAAVFLAPIVEEMLFRGAVFGALRKWNRTAAYAGSMLLFSLYHVWAYAMEDPIYWIYLLQYLPVSYLLCRCYEKTDSLWCSIFFHMLVNGVSMRLLLLLQEVL